MFSSFLSKKSLLAIALPGVVLFAPAFSGSAQSLPTECIQDPARNSVCPRLIYKSAELPHPETRELATQLVCVCLADFADLLVPADTEVEKKIKEMRMKSLTAQLQLTEEQLLNLIKY